MSNNILAADMGNSKSPWDKIKEQRALVHRLNCVKIANQILDHFQNYGIDGVVFGSLVNKHSFFRDNSDIDICIMNKNNYSFAQIEHMVFQYIENIKFDLIEFEKLEPHIQFRVKNNGVKHVE
jgi:predicted nucleotidyltransferase